MANIFTKIFGSRNDRILKDYYKTTSKINSLESEYEQLTDEQLQQKTAEFKERIKVGYSLNKILPEAFAVVREAAKRTLGMRIFDVQLMGAIALHQNKIAEMRTGEGKTLTSTLAIYLNALTGQGVHIVTVNDYLAKRDAEEMGVLYRFLGLSVGINLSQMPKAEKQAAYNADITYGTNNEYGFDYLRDNMVYASTDRVQRKLHYAIVDEVDSILIDEARTPLIISGQAEDHTAAYIKINQIVPKLTKQIGEENVRTGEGVELPGDFTVDEKSHQVHITEAGHEKIEQIMSSMDLIPVGTSLYDPSNIMLLHQLNAALRAHHLFHRDQQYVVNETENGKEIVIVDEFTGRIMSGRRWSDGLHQAIEAKEGVDIQAENQTLASITFQNYFRLYEKLAGMTGTADTEAYEFQTIYGLETVVIPPNLPSQRNDQQDRIYKTEQEKYQAAIKDIQECYERGQPVLVGTSSIENSEIISELLKKVKLPHQLLNAKQHEREADIIIQAGRPKVITIATNMAGRGTDIVLGGNIKKNIADIKNDEQLTEQQKQHKLDKLQQDWRATHEQIKQLGGLRIVATERHESRRIDNQLRGRSGRQGDPGSSRFYLSLDDQLMRIFAGEKVKAIMNHLRMPEGEAIEAKMVSRSIETAQRKVEGRNFDVRKQLLEYDDVANEQRKSIYQQRNALLDDPDIQPIVDNLRDNLFISLTQSYVPAGSMEEVWQIDTLEKVLIDDWQLTLYLTEDIKNSTNITAEDICDKVVEAARKSMQQKIELAGKEQFMHFERAVLLQNVDSMWREHLSSLDYLRRGIHLRGFAQKQPKQEYKREAFELFSVMLDSIRDQSIKIFMNVRIQSPETVERAAEQTNQHLKNEISNLNYQGGGQEEEQSEQRNIGRNEPCPCGSGKKFKQCHGKLK